MPFTDLSRRFLTIPLLVLMLFCLSGCQEARHQHEGTLNGDKANQLIKDMGKKLNILDVRTPEEYAQCHLKGAINIPVDTLADRIASLPEGPILIVCRRGRRAHKAYHIILEAQPGRKDVYYLDGTPTYKPDGTCNCVTFQ